MQERSITGFTLIELLIVIAIIGVLSTLATVSFINSRQKARDGQRKSDLNILASALEQYRSDAGSYPVPSSSLYVAPCNQPFTSSDSSITYLKHTPCDPSNSSQTFNSGNYVYLSSTGSDYTLVTCLENTNDTCNVSASQLPAGVPNPSSCPSGKFYILTDGNAQCSTSSSSSSPTPSPSDSPTPSLTVAPSQNPPISSTVVINTSQQLGKIPQNFIGLSVDKQNICALVLAEAANPQVDTYLTNLNPMVLRIGGTSADNMTWNSTGSNCSGGAANGLGNRVMSKAMIDDIFTLAQKDNFKIYWTVNLKTSDPTTSSQEAQYVAQNWGSNLAGIMIGNEPDVYGGTWTYASYQTAWESFDTAVKAAIPPGTSIVSPETAYGIRTLNCNDASSWLQQFLPAEGIKVNPATFHIYFSNSSNAQQGYYLDPTNMSKTVTYMKCDANAASATPVPIVATEWNSSSQAVDGITNVFEVSLWGLDFLLNAAESGISGMDIYGSYYPGSISQDQAFVQASGGTLQAAPIYYPMFLIHNLARGGTLVKTTTTTSINLVSHAVIVNGNLQIFLINKDQTNDTTAQVSIPAGYTKATDIRMQASALNSKTVTLGGSSIAPNGTWSATTTETIPIANNSFSITTPHTSAVAITVSP